MSSDDPSLEKELANLRKNLKKWKKKHAQAVQERKDVERLLASHREQPGAGDGGGGAPSRGPAPSSTPPPRPPTASRPQMTSSAPTPTMNMRGRPALRGRAVPPRGLANARIPVVDRSKKGLKDIPDDLLSKDYLTKLYLMQNLISSLPPTISQWTKMTFLNLNHNRLTSIHPAIAQLESLQTLKLVGNQLDSLPMELAALEALETIDLTRNKLTEFPEVLCEMVSITDINLSRNTISAIPASIENLCEVLSKLDLSENHIEALPPEIGTLVYVEQMVIKQNKLSSIPAEIGQLNYLMELDLSWNDINDLPDEMSAMVGLTKLSLKSNNICKLPPFTDEACWSALETLDVSRNRIDELPGELWGFTELVSLDATSNNISSLPEGISGVSKLTELFIGDNQVTELPEEICQLGELERLRVFFNRLTRLPDGMCKLERLVELQAGYNELTSEGFPSLDGCDDLEHLFLSGNPMLKELHPSIGSLRRLQELYAFHCGLECVPEWVGEGLQSLVKVDFGANNLSSVPANLCNLEMMQSLNVQHNALTTLPPELAGMGKFELTEIDVTDNEIAELPPAFADVAYELITDGNPMMASAEHRRAHPPPRIQSTRYPTLGCAEMIGRRPTMEDAFCIAGNFMGRENHDVFGLFDGHAGREAASYCGEHFPSVLQSLVERQAAAGEEDHAGALADAFPHINPAIEEYLATQSGDTSRHAGTTGVVCFIDPERRIHVADVGDSRAVLSRDGVAQRLSFDHKPYDPVEEERIQSLGGCVIGETGRVNGLLAVSRSLGDFYMHPYVIPTAYQETYQLNDQDDLLILACDGVWDEVTDQQAVDLARTESDPVLQSAKIRDYAYLLGSDDNISVMTIHLANS